MFKGFNLSGSPGLKTGTGNGSTIKKTNCCIQLQTLVISVFGENETNESVTLHRDILGAFSNVFYLLSEKKWLLFCLFLVVNTASFRADIS